MNCLIFVSALIMARKSHISLLLLSLFSFTEFHGSLNGSILLGNTENSDAMTYEICQLSISQSLRGGNILFCFKFGTP